MPVLCFHSKVPGFAPATLRRSLNELLRYLKMDGAMLELRMVGNPGIRALNKKYLRKDRVTDVLSFPIDARSPGKGFPWHLGQVVIAVPVARIQARDAGRSLTQQVIRLAVHGLVHLTGRDHEAGSGPRRDFEKMEEKCLKRLQRKGLSEWDGSLRL